MRYKKTRTIERTRNKWNKKWNKKKFKYVRWWNKRYILEKSDEDLTTLITKRKWLSWLRWKRKRTKNICKKKINEIERLKEEVKSNEDKLLDSETKISKLLTDLNMKNIVH